MPPRHRSAPPARYAAGRAQSGKTVPAVPSPLWWWAPSTRALSDTGTESGAELSSAAPGSKHLTHGLHATAATAHRECDQTKNHQPNPSLRFVCGDSVGITGRRRTCGDSVGPPWEAPPAFHPWRTWRSEQVPITYGNYRLGCPRTQSAAERRLGAAGRWADHFGDCAQIIQIWPSALVVC